jgi:hypothetical protein
MQAVDDVIRKMVQELVVVILVEKDIIRVIKSVDVRHFV